MKDKIKILTFWFWWIASVTGAPRGRGSASLGSAAKGGAVGVLVGKTTAFDDKDESEFSYTYLTPLIVCLVTVLNFLFILTCCIVRYCRGFKEFCPLCQKYIQKVTWENGEHRAKCVEKNKKKIEKMSSSKLKCSKCKKSKLRLWPLPNPDKMEMERPFSCCEDDCSVIGQIKNNGSNKFSCFVCDFHICDNCHRQKLDERRRRKRRRRREQKRRRREQQRRPRGDLLTVPGGGVDTEDTDIAESVRSSAVFSTDSEASSSEEERVFLSPDSLPILLDLVTKIWSLLQEESAQMAKKLDIPSRLEETPNAPPRQNTAEGESTNVEVGRIATEGSNSLPMAEGLNSLQVNNPLLRFDSQPPPPSYEEAVRSTKL